MFYYLASYISLLISILPLSTLGNSLSSKKSPVAIVYSGPGSCSEGCAQAAADIASSMGFLVRFVDPRDLSRQTFDNVELWIQPGGNAIVAAEALGTGGLKLIREFVRRGGSYVGICAGAFLADKTVDDFESIRGLGISPVETADYPVDSNKRRGVLVWLYTLAGEWRQVFFNGGGTFILTKNSQVNVLATYGKEGLPATIQAPFGRGNLVLTGVHPEAPDLWKSDTGMIDQDGPDFEMARFIISRAMVK